MGKKELAFILVLTILPLGMVFSQQAEFSAVDNLSSVKEKLREGALKIKTIKSEFTQQKKLAVLEEELISQGKFFFKRENKVKLEYTTPFYYIMIINGDHILIKDNTRENKVNMGSSKLFKEINGIMVDAMQGTILDNPAFSGVVKQNKNQYWLHMTPTSKMLKELFSSIDVYIDRTDLTVNEILMLEVNDDTTKIVFINKQLNIPLPDEDFVVR